MEAAVALLCVVTVASVVVAWRASLEARRARATLAEVRRSDPLTGLLNRAQLEPQLERLLHESRRTSGRVGVLAVELDRFSALNETYGHEVGDAILAATGATLDRFARKRELVARVGGPQFVVVIPSVTDPHAARLRAEELLDRLQRPHEIRSPGAPGEAATVHSIRLTANVGVVVTDQHHTSAADVLFDAGVALRTAIGEGPGATAVFDTAKRGMAVPSVTVHRLHAALEEDEFSLRYLPVVDLADGRIVGVEALLRWENPQAGVTTADRFIEALEESGLIVPVGRWALGEACRQAREWRDRHPGRPDELTVNLSPRQLTVDLPDHVAEALDRSGLPPAALCLEITEGARLVDVDDAWEVLRRVKALGVRLGLDDFGTGSATLGHLRRLQLDALKIDRSLVASVVENAQDRALLSQLVGLAHSLGMRTVAEGVETASQVVELRAVGCDRAQGHHFSPPLTAEAVAPLLAEGRLGSPSADGDPLPVRPPSPAP